MATPDPGVQLTAFTDLFTATHTLYPVEKKTIANMRATQSYPIMEMLLGQVELSDKGGKTISDQINIPGSKASKQDRTLASFQTRTGAITDTIHPITVPWSLSGYTVTYGEDEANLNPKDRNTPQKIKDIVNARRLSASEPYMDGLSYDMTCLPTLVSGEKAELRGLSYCIVPITAAQHATALAANGGQPAFQGMNPVSSTDGSATSDYFGIDRSSATYAKARNLNCSWLNTDASVTENDRVHLNQAFRLINFKPVPMQQGIDTPVTQTFRGFADQSVLDELGKASRAQNDTLGIDITERLGMVYVNGLHIEWDPVLDNSVAAASASTTAPVFGSHPLVVINPSQIRFLAQRAKYFKNRAPVTPWDKPDVILEYIDSMFQILVKNPQQLGFTFSVDA